MKHIPTRTCIVCKTPKLKRELLRVVRNADGTIALDPTGKLAGRGCYVCDTEACFQKMLDKKMLSRAFKCEIGKDVYQAVRESYLAKNQ
jgi:predicted RNA-binding protein YlxR (DUF448 family)